MSHDEAVATGKVMNNTDPGAGKRTMYAAVCPELEHIPHNFIRNALNNRKPNFSAFIPTNSPSYVEIIAKQKIVHTLRSVDTKGTVKSGQYWNVHKREENLIDLSDNPAPSAAPSGNKNAQLGAKPIDLLWSGENTLQSPSAAAPAYAASQNGLTSTWMQQQQQQTFFSASSGSNTQGSLFHFGSGPQQHQDQDDLTMADKSVLSQMDYSVTSAAAKDPPRPPTASNSKSSDVALRQKKRARIDTNEEESESTPQTPSLALVEVWTDELFSAHMENEVGADLRHFQTTRNTDIPSTLRLFGQSQEYIETLVVTASKNLSFLMEARGELMKKRGLFDKARMQHPAGHCGNTLGLKNLSIGGSINPPSHVSFSDMTNDDISMLSGGTMHTSQSQGKGSSRKTEVPLGLGLGTVEEGEETTDVETETASDESNKVGTDESKSNSDDTECAQSQFGVVEVEDASASQM